MHSGTGKPDKYPSRPDAQHQHAHTGGIATPLCEPPPVLVRDTLAQYSRRYVCTFRKPHTVSGISHCFATCQYDERTGSTSDVGAPSRYRLTPPRHKPSAYGAPIGSLMVVTPALGLSELRRYTLQTSTPIPSLPLPEMPSHHASQHERPKVPDGRSFPVPASPLCSHFYTWDYPLGEVALGSVLTH
jgi:hypothetical protein